MILNWRTGIFQIKNVKMNMYIPEFNIIVSDIFFMRCNDSCLRETWGEVGGSIVHVFTVLV